MTTKEKDFIYNHDVAHLSTVDSEGDPHVVPIVYGFDGKLFYTPVDSKPKKIKVTEIKRVKNIKFNSSVSVVIDDYSENWEKLAWVQIRGVAKLITKGDEFEKGVEIILKKYPQYSKMNLNISMLIVISPDRVLSWQVS